MKRARISFLLPILSQQLIVPTGEGVLRGLISLCEVFCRGGLLYVASEEQ